MGTYGKNIEFLVVPRSENRGGRYATQSSADYATVIPMGAPVEVVGEDALLRATVELASDATPPVKGRAGIAIYEHGDGATWAGDDQSLTTYSDKGVLPFEKAIQVVSGPNVKVLLTNTDAETFLNTRSYAGRNMVAELGGSPAVTVGAYLEPHSAPTDADGYWQVTVTAANAWLVVTRVDSDRNEVEAQMLF